MVLSPSLQQRQQQLQQGAAASTRRPRAFGRTSNVWQYVESVQERLTPSVKLRDTLASGDHLRRTSLDFEEGDEDEGGGENNESARRFQSHEQRDGYRRRLSSHTNSKQGGLSTGDASQDPFVLPKRKFSKALALNGRYKRSSKTGMQSVSSLPELHAPPATAVGDTNVGGKNGTATPAGLGSVKRTLYGGAASASALSPTAKKSSGATCFNANEVIKRIQALGTSTSAPYLPMASSLGTGTAPMSAGQGLSAGASSGNAEAKAAATAPPQGIPQQSGTGGAASGSTAAPAAAAVSGGASASATAPGPVLSDAEKLRNDFNSQQSKLYYGCSVAFELFNGHLMMVGSPDGQVRVQSLEKLQMPQIKGCRDRAIFTMLDLTDVHSANTICYGDAVWLQLSIGTGDVSWEQGGVLGAKVREAPQLKALALSSDGAIRNSAQAPVVVGHPVPVKAYLPKSREDGDTQADEIQSRVRNKGSRMLGKWIIRSAVMGPRKHKDNFVYNNDEIYLEQDWFYLGADSDAGIAVLRQLPPSSSLKDVKDGEYLIERRAAWRIRLLDSTNGGAGLSLAQQQMERLLFRAKMQLKQSKKMRAGQTKAYAPDLHGGSTFTSQLRSKIAVSTRECDERHLERQDQRLEHLAGHLGTKAEAMNRRASRVDINGDFEFPSDFRLQDAEASASRGSDSATPALAIAGTAPSGKSSPVPKPPLARAPSESSGETSESAQHVCALCQSSTIGYNLCSQIHSVMHAIASESELETATGRLHSQRSELKSSGGSNAHSRASKSGSHSVVFDASSDSHSEDPGSSSTSNSRTNDAESSGGRTASGSLQSSHRKSRYLAASTAAASPLLPQESIERDRILALFSLQDAHMLEIIKFKERTAREALIAEEHARMGLSPVATHFRDRFKHVGLLAQAHMPTHDTQHGIGGHFQKLHAELFTSAATSKTSGGRKAHSRVERLAQEQGHATFSFDMRTCPLEHPGEGFDVFGNPIDDEGPDPVQRTRMFPSEDELALVAPIDTKAAMETYAQNRAAVVEMLDGFVELCQTHMMPNLHVAMETYNRTALVETLEFTARAAEFVCARRIQVHVAQLLHVVAASDLGDFAALEAPFDALMAECTATLAFIKFYREQHDARSKTKKKRK